MLYKGDQESNNKTGSATVLRHDTIDAVRSTTDSVFRTSKLSHLRRTIGGFVANLFSWSISVARF